MKKTAERICAVALACCLVSAIPMTGFSSQPSSLHASSVDIVVLMDLSGSVVRRYETGFLPVLDWTKQFQKPGDRVAVVVFGSKARTIHPLMPSNEFKPDSENLRIFRSSKYTDVVAGLNAARRHLEKSDRKKLVILFSDGHMDLQRGHGAVERSRRYLQKELIPAMVSDGISIISLIPQSRTVDYSLLSELSERTGGQMLSSDQNLPWKVREDWLGSPERSKTSAELPAQSAAKPSGDAPAVAGIAKPQQAASPTTDPSVTGVSQATIYRLMAVSALVFLAVLAVMAAIIIKFVRNAGSHVSANESAQDSRLLQMLEDVRSLRASFAESEDDTPREAAMIEADAPSEEMPEITATLATSFLEYDKTVFSHSCTEKN
jgi:hypothetical protein